MVAAHADYYFEVNRLTRSNAHPSHELPGGLEDVASRVGSDAGDTASQWSVVDYPTSPHDLEHADKDVDPKIKAATQRVLDDLYRFHAFN